MAIPAEVAAGGGGKPDYQLPSEELIASGCVETRQIVLPVGAEDQ